ncbi:hypothetical protein C2E23DRAFT_949568 [Lenzites betulinus]|nr:hypothetical protein C2E23DRAFT_949568 [Lenzites betulinus]
MRWISGFAVCSILWSSLSRGVAGATRAAGNTTCASTQLDWYTDVVGETPCATYQKLRQICNPDYLVPQMNTDTPGDTCSDQLSTCCCNSISWALSMLCMNCQYDLTPGGSDSGIDAGAGAYGIYSRTCGKPLNQTLPTDIQTAVCNKAIKLDDNLYSLFWVNGDCVYTKQQMSKNFAVTNNNSFTHCNSTLKASAAASLSSSLLPTSTSTSSSSSAATPQSSSESSHSAVAMGPIIGGAVGGGLIAMGLIALGFFLLRRRRRRQGPTPLDLSKEYNDSSTPATEEEMVVTPFSAPSAHSNLGYGGGKSASEEFALLPRGYTSPAATEKLTSPWGASTHSLAETDGERHEDGGPAAALQRSASGRLPPAYRRSWDGGPDPAQVALPPSEVGSGSGMGSPSVSGSGSGGGSTVLRVVSPGRDVKRPLPPPDS